LQLDGTFTFVKDLCNQRVLWSSDFGYETIGYETIILLLMILQSLSSNCISNYIFLNIILFKKILYTPAFRFLLMES